ncbi:MAG: arsenite methyltransferase [Candidatus Thorarchaeota archaeon]
MTKKVTEMSPGEIKDAVQDAYASLAKRKASTPTTSSCCGPQSSTTSGCGTSGGCGPSIDEYQMAKMKEYGYSIEGLPSSMTESYGGCGNPIALASLNEGETVLDLGSGAGLDAYFAAQKVGPTGKVIGVDMTPEMLEKARKNAEEMGMSNIEFREGDIEDLPVEDNSVDVIISNCVINLAPDKAKVFREAFRVLKPGGRVMVSDVVLNRELTDEIRNDIANYTGCIGGAIPEHDYLQKMKDAGFIDAHVVEKVGYGIASSARISAIKPA